MALIRKVAHAISRTPVERRLIADIATVRAKYLLFGILAMATALMFIPAFAEQFERWNDTSPTVAIAPDEWKSLFEKSAGPCESVAKSPDCFANPANPNLWSSKSSRADKAHVDRVRSRGKEEFWIGATIPGRLLQAAAQKEANHFLLGWVRGNFKVWIDGELVLSGNRASSDAVVMPFTMPRLASGRDMHIAIQIFNESDHPYPDFFNSGRGGEGFGTYAQSVAYRSFRTFLNATRPFSLFLANILIGMIFLLFWSAAKTKQEYFYMAIFSITNALIQLRGVDAVFMRLDLNFGYAISIFLRITEGCAALLLGLAFARARRIFFQSAIAISIIYFGFSIAANPTALKKFFALGTLGTWFVPASYVIGAIACAIQAAYLQNEAMSGTHLPIRIRRLWAFCFGMVALAALYWSQASGITSASHHVFWHKLIHLTLVIFLGVILFTEYREQELMVEKTPVSEYHRRPVLPSKLTGAIIVADLKASEAFFKQRASQGDNENIVTIWRSHFYTAIHKHGGTVLYKKGDEVIGFFDSDKCEIPGLSALQAIEEIAQASQYIETDFRNRHLFPEEACGLHFRAALALGDIRPVWENMGNSREAYWEEAGNTTPLVEASRLMEFERKICENPDSSLLVLRYEVSQALGKVDKDIASRMQPNARELSDKHGTVYKVGVYQPQARRPRTEKNKAA